MILGGFFKKNILFNWNLVFFKKNILVIYSKTTYNMNKIQRKKKNLRVYFCITMQIFRLPPFIPPNSLLLIIFICHKTTYKNRRIMAYILATVLLW